MLQQSKQPGPGYYEAQGTFINMNKQMQVAKQMEKYGL